MNTSTPQIVYKWKKYWFFKLVRINYHVEDRRPDLKEYPGKYLNVLTVRVLNKRYYWSFRTDYLKDNLPAINHKSEFIGNTWNHEV